MQCAVVLSGGSGHCPGVLPAEVQLTDYTGVRRGKYKRQKWIFLFFFFYPSKTELYMLFLSAYLSVSPAVVLSHPR